MKASDVIKNIEKEHGTGSVSQGGDYPDVERIPTGVFPFDLSCGGGFPRGKVSIVYGPESSGKTNLYLLALAMEQKLNPGMMNVFIDVEHAFDAKWAIRMGVDVQKLIILKPDFAEQAIDMMDSFLQAEDVSLVIVDSLAAMTPRNEQESTAEKAQVGGASALIGKMVRKAVSIMSKESKKEHYPTLLCVNQIRLKIGVMFGDPETMPGGNSMKFASGLTVRIYGKNKMDATVSPTIPAYKETSTVLKKWKVPVVSVNSKYDMVMIPHKGMKPGEVKDWNTISNHLKDMGFLAKGDKKGWIMFGEEFNTLTDCQAALYSDPAGLQKTRQLIIDHMLDRAHGGPVEFDGDVEA